MTIDFEEILSSTTYNSRGNHLICRCPFCDKEDHFYFNVEKALVKINGKYRTCWDCKKCSEKGSVVKLLRKLEKLHLLEGEYLGDRDFIENPFAPKVIVEQEQETIAKRIHIPIGFKRVWDDDYLRGERGFTDREFHKYKVGYTEMYTKLKDYVIILIEEQNKARGYIARSRLTKAEIKEINKQFKAEGLKQKYARYRNSTSAEFSKLLLGYEEIIFTTQWVILVEGFFDKTRTDQALGLDKVQEIKCCCTFGKDISNEQIQKLKRKGIKNVILIQDPDAVDHSKATGDRLQREFRQVKIGFTGEKDLGDSTNEQITEIFDNLKSPISYRFDVVQKKL